MRLAPESPEAAGGARLSLVMAFLDLRWTSATTCVWLAEGLKIPTSIPCFSQLELSLAGWGKAIILVVSASLDSSLEETSPLFRKSAALSRWFLRGLIQRPLSGPLSLVPKSHPPHHYRSQIRRVSGLFTQGVWRFLFLNISKQNSLAEKGRMSFSCSPTLTTLLSPHPRSHPSGECNWLILCIQISTRNTLNQCQVLDLRLLIQASQVDRIPRWLPRFPALRIPSNADLGSAIKGS